MTSTRSAVKGIAEAALVRSGFAGLLRRRFRGRAIVLAYHNVVPTGERSVGEASLHLPQLAFAAQLDLIASTARVVPLASLFDDDTESDGYRVAITFDDAYHGAVTVGLEELSRRSLPATVFVAPGLLGGDTWWDCLAEAHGGVVPDDVRRYAIEKLRGDRDSVLEWFAAGGGNVAAAGVLPRIADESDLATASHRPGMTFGAHSWSHRNLSALSASELEPELAPALAWLRARYANTIPWLTYPYGLASAAVERASEGATFRGAFMVTGGWMTRDPIRLHALPRLGIPAGLSPNGLRLRLSGIASTR